ncbi:MAG: glyceraldehyde 3-phosphate dehydrogenase NAD-binding domain-containing protein [Cyanobacteria bacterium J06642_2]
MARVGINGFGRIGRLVLRASRDWPELEFVHVNELHGGAATAAHLLKFDSVLKAAADGPLQGILGYEERPLVSIDYVNDPRSAIVDALSTMVLDETQVTVLVWYDNEWGYSNRMAELAQKVARLMTR